MSEDVVVMIGFGILCVGVPAVGICWFALRRLRSADAAASQRMEARRTQREATAHRAPVGPSERAFLKGCSNCEIFSITLPFRDRAGRTYCSQSCLDWLSLGSSTFCQRCISQSTDEGTGNLNRLNGIGRTLGSPSRRCPTCRSVIERVWFTVLYLPVLPLGHYRVIHRSPREFWSRRLRA